MAMPPEQYFVGSTGLCKPGFMSIDVPEPYGPNTIVIGEIFMRQWYTIYDGFYSMGSEASPCCRSHDLRPRLAGRGPRARVHGPREPPAGHVEGAGARIRGGVEDELRALICRLGSKRDAV